MKTKEEIRDELIEYYKIRVKELEGQLANLKTKYNEMERSFRGSPKDKWYIDYLMKTNAMLERQCDDRQDIIEQYQKHYQKFGHFYTEYERSRGLDNTHHMGDSTDANRGD